VRGPTNASRKKVWPQEGDRRGKQRKIRNFETRQKKNFWGGEMVTSRKGEGEHNLLRK